MTDPFDLTEDPLDRPDQPPAARLVGAGGDPPWLVGLNPEQRAAVMTTEGPVLVLSGAGTGKTRVLTTRLAQILATRPVRPWQILAVTFTNKAAREMRERAAAMVGPVVEQVWLGTFHALGLRILRRHPELVGLRSGFTILDADDQTRLLRQIMEAEGLDIKKWTPQATMGVIQRWKDRGLGPDAVPDRDPGRGYAADRALDLYRQYQARLQVVNAADFGDLLLHCLTLFTHNPDVLEKYSKSFRYILVDEYQDTNVAQYLWLRLLARGHGNLCCVGDDDQSIYSWRGAEVGNILRFETDFPGATVVRLERNYRSTATILAAASGLIRHNTGRLGKELRAAAGVEGAGDGAGDEDEAFADPEPRIQVRGVWDGDEEARWMVDEIDARHRAGESLNSMAVLVRTGFQTRPFEERLIVTGTPYRVVGGPRFYERQEIRDALAYLRLVAQPDDSLAFERIVNVPRRGLGDATVQTLHQAARLEGVSLTRAAQRLLQTDELRPQARSRLRGFLEDLSRWRAQAAVLTPAALCGVVLDESGYTDMWRADKRPEAEGRLETLKDLVGALGEFDSLTGFLEHVSLVMDNEARAGEEAVSLMTLHAAKGLEFDTVFLPGWEEDLFPHRRALDDGGVEGLEEERRLAYVGLTRARLRVFIGYAGNRRVFNDWRTCLPSRFLAELPATVVDHTMPGGIYGSGAQGLVDAPGGWGRLGGTGAGSGPGSAFGRPSAGEATAWPGFPADEAGAEDPPGPGDRVVHPKFGLGRVLARRRDSLTIAFDAAGTREVLASFVKKG